ncbi:MAG: hypothetical protein JWO57_2351 [Pseudonocardiales bacterium]|jgi:hypothetical protein|nr:hypothetical protein [Pseudonocardiales bacterium]
MRKFSKKQYLAAGAAAVIIAGGAGTAFAYWTTSGSGTGSGTAATANGTLGLHASFASDTLTPGNSVPVSFTADNTNSSDLQVGTVHTVVTTTPAVDATGTCNASWFSVADVTENQVITHNTSGTALATGGTLVFAESGTNQDGCKGATITLTLTS